MIHATTGGPATRAAAVLAHGIGSREDLPLPLAWAVAAAVAAVVVSFVALGLLWHEPRLEAASAGRPLPAAWQRVLGAVATRRLVAGAGLLVTAWTGLALVLGRDDARNPVPWVVFVLLWVGLVPVSVLLGPVYRWLNPLRTGHALLNRAMGLDPAEGLRPLPDGLGWWPAAAGLLAFTWLELVHPDAATLTVLRFAIGLYAGVQLLAALVYGSRWFDRGDAFEAWSGLYGQLASLGRRADGRFVLRAPLAGLGGVPPAPGLVATVAVMLGSTAFDGLSGSTAWVSAVQSSPVPRMLAGTLGLLATIGVVGGLYLLCTRLAGVAAARVGPGEDAGGPALPGRTVTGSALPAAFAPSVVPVALGYVVAHYYSLFVLEGQRALARLSDPLGTGADWLGTGGLTPSTALVAPAIVANVQVLAIVLGHVCGVVLAHDTAVRLFPRRAAVAGQLPLLALMVCLTCLGLFLLFWG